MYQELLAAYYNTWGSGSLGHETAVQMSEFYLIPPPAANGRKGRLAGRSNSL